MFSWLLTLQRKSLLRNIRRLLKLFEGNSGAVLPFNFPYDAYQYGMRGQGHVLFLSLLYHFKPFVFTVRFHGRKHKGNRVDGKPVDKRAPSCAVLLLGGRRRWIGILFLLRLVRVGRDRYPSIEDVNKTAPHKLLFPFLVSPILRHIISLKNV